MKKFLLASVAAAAFCGAPAIAAPPAAPVFNWTGFYIGGYAGGGINQSHMATPGGPGEADINGTGFTGGLQAGYNWQFSPQWVFGIEGDIGYLGINRSFMDWGDPVLIGVKTGAYGTLRGRFGYSTGPSLLYVTGGAAFVNVKNTFGEVADPEFRSKTATGWTGGGGIETMIARNWSAKLEYLYIDAGSRTWVHNTRRDPIFDNRFHVVKLGLNYQFGGGPVIAGTQMVAPYGNWTGFYTGLNAGVGTSHSTATGGCCASGLININGNGFTGGLQAGYNWQSSPQWVFGVEGDIGYLGIDNLLWPWNESPSAAGVKTGAYGTLRGRFGYSAGPSLFYATAGAAFVNVKNAYGSPSGAGDIFTASKTASGWTGGGGVETMIARNWSAKLEYLYIHAGSQDVTDPSAPDTLHLDNRFHVVKFGLNYKFGP